MKHLFIGSEGALGLVTKVAIQCPAKPKAMNLAFLGNIFHTAVKEDFSEFSGLPSFESVLKVLKQAKRELGEVLASCELIDESTLHVCTENLKLKSPLPEYPFYMLIETHGSNNDHDQEKLNTFLEEVMASGLVLNGTVTNEPNKMKVL